MEEFAALQASNMQLHAMMSKLLTSISALSSVPMALQQPALAPSTLAGGPFVPPILGNSTNGASPLPLSLRTQFPNVDAAVIMAIIMHKFKAADLHKLDPTNRNKETAYTFNSATNQFEVSHQVAKEYRMPFSVLIPL